MDLCPVCRAKEHTRLSKLLWSLTMPKWHQQSPLKFDNVNSGIEAEVNFDWAWHQLTTYRPFFSIYLNWFKIKRLWSWIITCVWRFENYDLHGGCNPWNSRERCDKIQLYGKSCIIFRLWNSQARYYIILKIYCPSCIDIFDINKGRS